MIFRKRAGPSGRGFSSQFDVDYEIDPRFPRDVVSLKADDHGDCGER